MNAAFKKGLLFFALMMILPTIGFAKADKPKAKPKSSKPAAAVAKPQAITYSEEESRRFYNDTIGDTMNYLNEDRLRCERCKQWSNEEGLRELQACERKWRSFYAKDTIDMRVVFGYSDLPDSGGFVEDRYAAETLREQATRSCQKENGGLCGFSRTDDEELYIKNLIGPDGRTKTVQLRIVNSAFSNRDSDNRDPKNRNKANLTQAAQSARARNVFLSGLREADVDLYVGHWRKGGGASMEPPVLNTAGKVDFNHYKKHRESYDQTISTLQEASRNGGGPQIVGFFACDSEQLGGAELQAAAPNSGMILAPGLSSWEASYARMTGVLDATLRVPPRCESQFHLSLNQAVDLYQGTAETRMTNFFNRIPSGPYEPRNANPQVLKQPPNEHFSDDPYGSSGWSARPPQPSSGNTGAEDVPQSAYSESYPQYQDPNMAISPEPAYQSPIQGQSLRLRSGQPSAPAYAPPQPQSAQQPVAPAQPSAQGGSNFIDRAYNWLKSQPVAPPTSNEFDHSR